MEIFALIRREIGQVVLARMAASINWHCAARGTRAVTSNCIWVMVQPIPKRSSVMVAVVVISQTLKPAAPSSAPKAMEKHPACAVASNSYGLLLAGEASRRAALKAAFLSNPLPVVIDPLALR